MRSPRFLFVFTPPYSGSTALAKILNTSPRSMILTERGEGQWLVPSMCAGDRWDPGKSIDWGMVKQTWLSVYQHVSKLVETVDVVIEKSPPNMLRIDKLREIFPDSACFAFNRNPYANCASILYRHFPADNMSPEDRADALGKLASSWLARSHYLRNAIVGKGMLHFSYEDFCESPALCVEKVLEICPQLESVDCNVSVRVKDYPEQGIINQNERQISLLTDDDVKTISSELGKAPALVEYFDYFVI